MACKNPFLEAERARKCESLPAAAEADLAKIAAACARARRPLRGQDKIAVGVDMVLNRRKVARQFQVDIGGAGSVAQFIGERAVQGLPQCRALGIPGVGESATAAWSAG